jgi:hypothetical protein
MDDIKNTLEARLNYASKKISEAKDALESSINLQYVEEKEKDIEYLSARERAAREIVRKALNGDIEACRYIIECDDHLAEMHFNKQMSKIKIPREISERQEGKEVYKILEGKGKWIVGTEWQYE